MIVPITANRRACQYTGSNAAELEAWLQEWVDWANSTDYCAESMVLSSSTNDGHLTLSVSPAWIGVTFTLGVGDWLMNLQGSWQKNTNEQFDQQWVTSA
jgi:hypothetical protein